MFNGKGQINMNSLLGNEIYNICKNKNIKNIFEVGTWNGEGSTICVMNAICNKETNSILYSLEADSIQYEKAQAFWRDKSVENNLVLLNGILHKEYALESEITATCGGYVPYINEHYIPEKKMLESNIVVDISSFQDIDVIILDGGEYTTRGDLNTLIKKNPKVIILDDTVVFKCHKIRNELLNDANWILFKENLHDRNGWCIFIHKNFSSEFNVTLKIHTN